MSRDNDETNKRRRLLHNKSKRYGLTICGMTEEDFRLHNTQMKARATPLPPGECLIEGSPCLLQGDAEGRYAHGGRKVTFGHHLAAREKWGLERLRAIDASKSQDSITVSHLCGTRRCCCPSHLVLETKDTNDQRTHCHFFMRRTLAVAGRDELKRFIAVYCPHEPKCATSSSGGRSQ